MQHAGNSYANGLIDRNGYQGKTKEQGLNRIDLGFRTINPTTGIFDRSDPMAEMTPDFSSFSYTLNNPVNFIDEFGLFGHGWDTRGREETDAEKANKEAMQQSENRAFIQSGYRDVMSQSGSGKIPGANTGNENEHWTQKVKINFGYYTDDVNTVSKWAGNVLSELNQWNPLYHFSNSISGSIRGKDINNNAMSKADIALATLSVIPGEGKAGVILGKAGYKSLPAFKKIYGKAGTNKAWHHIVEQHAANIQKFGAEQIHNIKNLIKLPEGAGSVHRKITGFYNSKRQFTGGKTVRSFISGKSFSEQFEFGVKTLKQIINNKPLPK